jgi:hypothetical protein
MSSFPLRKRRFGGSERIDCNASSTEHCQDTTNRIQSSAEPTILFEPMNAQELLNARRLGDI